ncbi:hypothetical protein MHBO_003541 [Bonamia ostreae]|uniref:Nucleoporin NSP1-like C-terminal domain-containing protein n=1 Tax=Bonamia ostreae TaxID=126728 RepID=A0ABV2AQT1_9EUKA
MASLFQNDSNAVEVSSSANPANPQSTTQFGRLNSLRVEDIFELWKNEIDQNEKCFKRQIASAKKTDLSLIRDSNQIKQLGKEINAAKNSWSQNGKFTDSIQKNKQHLSKSLADIEKTILQQTRFAEPDEKSGFKEEIFEGVERLEKELIEFSLKIKEYLDKSDDFKIERRLTSQTVFSKI